MYESKRTLNAFVFRRLRRHRLESMRISIENCSRSWYEISRYKKSRRNINSEFLVKVKVCPNSMLFFIFARNHFTLSSTYDLVKRFENAVARSFGHFQIFQLRKLEEYSTCTTYIIKTCFPYLFSWQNAVALFSIKNFRTNYVFWGALLWYGVISIRVSRSITSFEIRIKAMVT